MSVFLVFLLFVASALSQTTNTLKVCSSLANNDACQQIGRSGAASCQYNLHDVDCLLNIENNNSQFGRIKSEVAFLGASFLSDNVIVLGEIVERHSSFETVVVVKTEIPNGLENLRGKKLCHPGFKHDEAIPTLFLQELENQTIALNRTFCDSQNKTILERQISSLKYFFGDSCRPGTWTQNKDFDKYLKSEYSSLCNLCGPDKCDTDYKRPFNDSLKCLLNNNADVAVTTLREAKLFFSTLQNQQNYKYFCKNGSSSSYIVPCIWSQQTPDLLIGQRGSANNVKTYLRSFLGSKINETAATGTSADDDTLLKSFTKIFDLEHGEMIVFLPTDQSVSNYIKERRTIPTLETSKLCDSKITWCTYTNESLQKCQWLSQAALNRGIQPAFNCRITEGHDELACLDDIKKLESDITVASSDYAYASLTKKLINIAYVETDSRQLSVILAVKNTDDTSINNFQDLKGKKSCFPRFGGKEHLAFVDVTREVGIHDGTNCDYGQLLSDFVDESCTPGVRSNLLAESSGNVNRDKLCSLCKPINLTSTAAYCNDDSVQAYYESKGSLQCLTDTVAKFAVITRFTNGSSDNDSRFTVICRNNTLAAYPGFEVDAACALNVITSSQVVALDNNPKIPDIKLALYEFEKWFGQNLEKSFHLFDRFNNTVDLLFKDSTPGLSFTDDLSYIKNYDTLLRRANECKSSSTILQAASFTTIIGVIFVFFRF